MSEKKEYIERSMVIDRAYWITLESGYERKMIEADYAEAIPAADVEPVVRCPKCVNGQRVNNAWTRRAKDGTRRLDSFYCAHGKERER